MPGLIQYRTKPTQSGIFLVRYWIEIMDVGMLMPSLVSSMPMTSYVFFKKEKKNYLSVGPFFKFFNTKTEKR
jgi:hypothetical protein